MKAVDVRRLLKKNVFIPLGYAFVRKCRNNINTISHGRIARYDSFSHIVSRPGEPPNNLTRALNKSVKFKITRYGIKMGAGTQKRVDYAKKLETYMNRPFIKKSFLECVPTFLANLKRTTTTIVRRSIKDAFTRK